MELTWRPRATKKPRSILGVGGRWVQLQQRPLPAHLGPPAALTSPTECPATPLAVRLQRGGSTGFVACLASCGVCAPILCLSGQLIAAVVMSASPDLMSTRIRCFCNFICALTTSWKIPTNIQRAIIPPIASHQNFIVYPCLQLSAQHPPPLFAPAAFSFPRHHQPAPVRSPHMLSVAGVRPGPIA